MVTESAGMSRKAPAEILPVPERMLTPRRSSEWRARDRVRAMEGFEAVSGSAFTDVSLKPWEVDEVRFAMLRRIEELSGIMASKP